MATGNSTATLGANLIPVILDHLADAMNRVEDSQGRVMAAVALENFGTQSVSIRLEERSAVSGPSASGSWFEGAADVPTDGSKWFVVTYERPGGIRIGRRGGYKFVIRTHGIGIPVTRYHAESRMKDRLASFGQLLERV